MCGPCVVVVVVVVFVFSLLFFPWPFSLCRPFALLFLFRHVDVDADRGPTQPLQVGMSVGVSAWGRRGTGFCCCPCSVDCCCSFHPAQAAQTILILRPFSWLFSVGSSSSNDFNSKAFLWIFPATSGKVRLQRLQYHERHLRGAARGLESLGLMAWKAGG